MPELGIDWTFFRENTEGEYVLGSRGVEIPDTLAFDFKVTTNEGTKRIARAAFEYAKNNGKTNVAIVTKANIMKKTDGKFSELCHEVAKDYPGITAEDWYKMCIRDRYKTRQVIFPYNTACKHGVIINFKAFKYAVIGVFL